MIRRGVALLALLALLAALLLAAGLLGFGIAILIAAALAAAVLTHRTNTVYRGAHSDFERALLRQKSRPGRPEELARLERIVALGVAGAGDLHMRVRPRLRAIAVTLLAVRGIDLDLSGERARSLLGDELWALVRPDRESPADPFAPGISAERLAVAVTALETLEDS